MIITKSMGFKAGTPEPFKNNQYLVDTANYVPLSKQLAQFDIAGLRNRIAQTSLSDEEKAEFYAELEPLDIYETDILEINETLNRVQSSFDSVKMALVQAESERLKNVVRKPSSSVEPTTDSKLEGNEVSEEPRASATNNE